MDMEKVRRKLTAIFSADVKGYSRLMGDDEEATVRTITAYREVMTGLIAGQGGRVVDAKGDNVLAEFSSVVDAIRTAVDIQRELAKRNEDLPEHRRMAFRIGINLGDVIEDGETIYGDGVNIAARLESLADAGGICISGTAFEHVGKRLPLGYGYLGERAVKNIERPIRVYRVLMEPEHAGKIISVEERKPKGWGWKVAAGVLLLALMAGGLVWNFHWRDPKTEPASKDKMAFPLPDKPSVAVLPFVNTSDDPKQEFFSDGISEEIITALSKTPYLFVIARNSTFTYKGKSVKVKQVAEELGVRYVLEGSIRREGDKVRVTAQLIDALTGHHLWGERYDRHLRDLFALQDEITLKIITALQVKLTQGEIAAMIAKGTRNLEALLKCLQSLASITTQTREGNAMGRKLAEEAIALDPEYPRPHVALAQTYMLDVLLGTTGSSEEYLAKAMELIKRAISLDETNEAAHGVLAYLYSMMGLHDQAVAEAERAISLTPNEGARISFVLNNVGRMEEAIYWLKMARRINPTPTQAYFVQLATAYRLTERYQESIETCREGLQRVPNNIFIHLQMAATYSMMGRTEEARAAVGEVLKINPRFSLERYEKTLYFKNPVDVSRTLEALAKAGLN